MNTAKLPVLIAVAAAALLQPISITAAPVGAASEWRFRVLLDNKEIGFHDFRISRDDAGKVVDSDARFDVKIFFINAFSYRHRNQEVWAGDCLARLDAETDSNGKETRVKGEQGDDQFMLTVNDDPAALPACVKTFAYWDPSIIEADSLLNVQTGQLEPVSASRMGEDQVMHNGEPIDAVRYQLATNRGDISLWYDAKDGRWLALEAPAKGGRRLRYEPLALPENTPTWLSGLATAGEANEG
ncbi:MAG: DUF6134 family protein [Pseudomonadota bacterium]